MPFAELNELVNRLVHGLRAAGAEQGDRIVWCGPNSLEIIAVIHAARKAGLNLFDFLPPLVLRGWEMGRKDIAARPLDGTPRRPI